MIASHSSIVSAVRTERALVRARVMQALMDVGLSLPKARKSRTDVSDGVRPPASKVAFTPEDAIALAQAVTAASSLAGRAARRMAASRMRARKSARSM